MNGIEWEYTDSTGQTVKGYVEKVLDHGGTDVTYIMKNTETGAITLISGSRLKSARPIYPPHLYTR